MKFPLIVLFVGLATLAQSKEPSPSAVPAGVPPGAVPIEGHSWRWVDKAGKVWLYRATPFGMMRNEDPNQATAKRPAGVPVGAIPLGDNRWRWIDPQQKVWLFQETPTGLMKSEEPKGGVPSAGFTGQKTGENADAGLDLISVKDEGESLRFSRPGPFGMYSWVKKKTQLDRDETIVWERAQAKSGSVKKD